MTDLMNNEIESTENIPVDEEMMVETPVEMPPQRVHHIHIIAKEKWDNGGRDILSNSSWGSNPYPDTYVLVPDDMVDAINETCGFCDIELNEAGTEVVSFNALKKPEIKTPEPVLTPEQKRIAELEQSIIATEQTITDMDLQNIETQQALNDLNARLMVLEEV